MDNEDERNGQYYLHHQSQPYGDPPHGYEHPPQQSGSDSQLYEYPCPRYGYPSPGRGPMLSELPPPPSIYDHQVLPLPPSLPISFKPQLPQPYADPPQGYNHPQRLSRYHPQLYHHQVILPPPPPPQSYNHPLRLSRYHPQLYHHQVILPPPPPPQSYNHPLRLSRYHPQLYDYPRFRHSPYGYPSPCCGPMPMPNWSQPQPFYDHQASQRPPPSFKPSSELRTSIENQTDVAMGITKQLLMTVGKDKNMVYSPLSIHVVLSMILAGTKGHIHDQMLSFLKSKSINELNDLASNVVPLVFADGSSKGGPHLSFANGVWVEKTIHVKPGFKQVLDTTYKAALNQVDFIVRAEEVRCEVNSWAENETKGLIKEIIPPGSVNSGTRLVLANALYFKGSWEQKFEESMTRMGNFYFPNGRSVKTTFMSSWKSQFVSAFEGFKVLKLPYEQGTDYERHFSMYVFLPNARNGLQPLLERVCSESGFIDSHLPKQKAGGTFLIPKFKISAGFDAVEVLIHLGCRLKGLTEMVEGEEPAITNILHRAYIDVNEEGTEAAAVTVTLLSGSLTPEPPRIDFVADHPFLYLIREEVTGTVMFIGHVLNPTL